MTLAAYIETFKDMFTDALEFKNIGIQENLKNLVEASERISLLYEEAILVDNLDDAEAYYNEIRGELLECEETLEDIGYEGED